MQTEKRVIALGFFDGVHLGHGALLRRVGEKAAELGAVPAAVTFDTHPENLILKTPAVPLLSSPLDRAELMRRFYGIREVIVAHFDERMMHMPWREFVTDYLAGVHLVAGHDFHFGYKGGGQPGAAPGPLRGAGHRLRHYPQGGTGPYHHLLHLYPYPGGPGGDGAGQPVPGPPPHPDRHGGPRQEAGGGLWGSPR